MPFEKDNKLAKGGARPNAGRRAAETRDELKLLFDTALPFSDRKSILEVMNARARAGDADAAKFLFSYAFGKPVNLPDNDLAEYVQTVMNELILTLDEVAPDVRERFLKRLEEKGIDA